MTTREKCLVPVCNGEAYSRGLCRNCYGTAQRLIKRKATTWKDLEKNGKALKPKPGNRNLVKNPIVDWLLDDAEDTPS